MRSAVLILVLALATAHACCNCMKGAACLSSSCNYFPGISCCSSCTPTCCSYHIPVIEQCVTHRHHCFVRSVPVMKKVVTPIVERRTKLIPYRYNCVRHVARSVCGSVPVVQRMSQPVIHNRIRYIPVTSSRYSSLPSIRTCQNPMSLGDGFGGCCNIC